MKQILVTSNGAFLLNSASILVNTIALLVCLPILFRFKKELKIKNQRLMTLFLLNTYIMVTLYALSLLWNGVTILLGDLSIQIFDNSVLNQWCLLRTYVALSCLIGTYLSFSLQAIFRFCRIAYGRFLFFKTTKFFTCLFMIQIILSWSLPIFYILRASFNSEEHSCHCPFSDLPVLLYFFLCVYLLPMGFIGFIYTRIIFHTKNTPRILTDRGSRRDIIVIRRIIVLLSSLMILAAPLTILWIIYLFTGAIHPLSYRLGSLNNALGNTLLCIVTAYAASSSSALKQVIFGKIAMLIRRMRPALH